VLGVNLIGLLTCYLEKVYEVNLVVVERTMKSFLRRARLVILAFTKRFLGIAIDQRRNAPEMEESRMND